MKSPLSLQTRPTSDRLRETLFNILAPRIEGAQFLDLCAGSGAVGIEALSRGAAHVIFVDQSREMCALIETNLAALNIDESEVEVISGEAFEVLRMITRKEAEPSLTVGLVPRLADPVDIIFFDPPYASDYDLILNYVGEHAPRLLTKDGVLIVEHHKKKELAEESGELRRYRLVKQGDSALGFYQRTAA